MGEVPLEAFFLKDGVCGRSGSIHWLPLDLSARLRSAPFWQQLPVPTTSASVGTLASAAAAQEQVA